MKPKRSIGVRRYTLLLIGLLAGLAGCSEAWEKEYGCHPSQIPGLVVTLRPGSVELGPGETAQVQASLRQGGGGCPPEWENAGPPAQWSIGDTPGTHPGHQVDPLRPDKKFSDTLAGLKIEPTSGVNQATISLSSLAEPKLGGSIYHLGPAEAFAVTVYAKHGIEDGQFGTTARQSLGITVLGPKLREVYRSIKPSYERIEGTAGSHRLIRMEIESVVEVEHDPSGVAYTFEAVAEQDRSWLMGGSGRVAKVAGTPTMTLTVGSQGRSVRIRLTADFTGAHPSGQTTLSCGVWLELTARAPNGRAVKGIFRFNKDSNCVLCP